MRWSQRPAQKVEQCRPAGLQEEPGKVRDEPGEAHYDPEATARTAAEGACIIKYVRRRRAVTERCGKQPAAAFDRNGED